MGSRVFLKMPGRIQAKLFLPQTRILRSNMVTVSDMRTILEGDSDKGRVFVVMEVRGMEVRREAPRS